MNNNYNSNTVVKQNFAVFKQVDGRAAHITYTTRHLSWQSPPPPPTRSYWIHPCINLSKRCSSIVSVNIADHHQTTYCPMVLFSKTEKYTYWFNVFKLLSKCFESNLHENFNSFAICLRSNCIWPIWITRSVLSTFKSHEHDFLDLLFWFKKQNKWVIKQIPSQ